jgi:hypothetical protein
MTEVEWLACTNPAPMLALLSGKVSDRKFRLFACACCRRIWRLLPDRRLRQAVEVSERFADGRATAAERKAARTAAMQAHTDASTCLDLPILSRKGLLVGGSAKQAVSFAASRRGAADAVYCCRMAIVTQACAEDSPSPTRREDWHATRAAQFPEFSEMLRDIVGNPFRVPTFDAVCLRWSAGTVPAIARHVYEDNAFHDLPILADALEDAGCTHAELVAHCRRPGGHVRGCWAVDLVLGQS